MRVGWDLCEYGMLFTLVPDHDTKVAWVYELISADLIAYSR